MSTDAVCDPHREVRRATWRRSIKRRYHEYRSFCRLHGIRPVGGGRWTSHCAEVRQSEAWEAYRKYGIFSVQNSWVLDSPPHRFWLDRLTVPEIRELGDGLLLFGVVSSDAPAAAGLREQEVAA